MRREEEEMKRRKAKKLKKRQLLLVFIFVKFWRHSAARRPCLQNEEAPLRFQIYTWVLKEKECILSFAGCHWSIKYFQILSRVKSVMQMIECAVECSQEVNCSQVPALILMSYALERGAAHQSANLTLFLCYLGKEKKKKDCLVTSSFC